MKAESFSKTITVSGRELTIESGRWARQAGGSVTVRYGDSMVLVAATGSKSLRPGQDFFPLTCEYRPRFYAAGKIPGSFFRREARPDEVDTLSARLMDRPIRPLFPKGFLNEVQVIAHVISHDQENDPDVLALIGGSAALMVSDLPFRGPVAAIRIGRLDGELVAFPTFAQLEESDMNIIVAATDDAITMVEGEMKEVGESDLQAALLFAHEAMRPILALQKELGEALGKEKWPVEESVDQSALEAEVAAKTDAAIIACFDITGKHERSNALSEAKAKAVAAFTEGLNDADAAEKTSAVKEIFGKRVKHCMRARLLNDKVRIDGRKPDEIRTITIELGVLPRAHGSAVFTRGETQALVVSTLGTRDDEQRLDRLTGNEWRRFMLHYNFPSFSVGETRRLMGPGRREIGHGTLARRALAAQLPEHEDFPYTLRIVSDILESNGSSSMATVCGGSLSLLDAGIPLKSPVAGIAMGLVKEGDDFAVLTDISGDEDHMGDMDFKVCGTEAGVTAFQMDTKIGGIAGPILEQALEQAKAARLFLLKKMNDAISSPREEMSPFAPRIEVLHVERKRIGDLIGPGGKTVRGIQEACEVKVDIHEDGKVVISSPNLEMVQKARRMVEEIMQEATPGKIYLGLVKKTVDFGAFVEIFPGCEGLLHISEIAGERIGRVEDVLQEGDEVLVKCIEVDKGGKIRLSRKQAMGQQADA